MKTTLAATFVLLVALLAVFGSTLQAEDNPRIIGRKLTAARVAAWKVPPYVGWKAPPYAGSKAPPFPWNAPPFPWKAPPYGTPPSPFLCNTPKCKTINCPSRCFTSCGSSGRSGGGGGGGGGCSFNCTSCTATCS